MALKKALVQSFLEEMDNALPSTFDQTVIVAHQREGAMSMVDQLINWEPELAGEDDAN